MPDAVTDGPSVPIDPQPLDVLRARYAAAVAELIDQQDLAAGTHPPPSGDPRHVFDTQLGMRLIVSREIFFDGRIGVHLSASWHQLPSAPLPALLGEIVATWRVISGSGQWPELIAVSEGGIPHFFVPQVH